MAWTSLTFAFGSKLTSTKMTQLYDNFQALANGDSGAPRIQTPAIADGAVHRAKLSTTTGANFVGITGNTDTNIALSGGTYSWWTAGADFNPGDPSAIVMFGDGNTNPGVIGVGNTGGATATFYIDERYIQASPPYTHGPLFVFLMLNKSGEILNVSVAPDPPWAYHGPTDITPQYWRHGKAYRKVKRYEGHCLAQFLADEKRARRFLAGDVEPSEEEVELTLGYKDADKDIVPHPWVYNRADYFTDRVVVMLEPGTSLMLRLHEMAEQSHAREVRDLIRAGHLAIDNTALDLAHAPRGVMICRAAIR